MIELEGFDSVIQADKVDEPDQNIIDRLRFDDALDVPWQITDLDLWANYTDDDLYNLDKKLRQYFMKHRWQRERKGGQKTALPLVFAWMFGRKPEPSDSQVCVKLHKLLKYYSTRYTGRNVVNGKQFTRVYYFSPYATKNKRPYSLRLRLEECNASSAFQPYGSNRDKGPAREKARYADRGNGPGADVGSCAYKRGPASKTEVSNHVRSTRRRVSGSEDVHGCSVQPGHQEHPDDHKQD